MMRSPASHGSLASKSVIVAAVAAAVAVAVAVAAATAVAVGVSGGGPVFGAPSPTGTATPTVRGDEGGALAAIDRAGTVRPLPADADGRRASGGMFPPPQSSRLFAFPTRRVDVAAVLSPKDKIIVGNLTVSPHVYDVEVQFDARMLVSGAPAMMHCGVIDNNGLRRFFITDDRPVRSAAGWEHHTMIARVALPDMTIGLRCVADRTALYSASFRRITFAANEVDPGRRDFFG